MYSPSKRWTHRVVAVGAVMSALGLLACGDSELTSPQTDVLVGQWGSATAELLAIHSGAELSDGCNTIVINRPIVLGKDGSFQVGGQLRTGGMSTGGPMITIAGRVQGSIVLVSAEFYSTDGAVTLSLASGVVPGSENKPECPQ